MEFWGVEIKPGETVKCAPGEDKYLHLSQASLGVMKKDKADEKVPVYVTFNGQKLIIGTLSGEKCRQIPYDLVFEKEFELSHGSKSTSVHFCGYKTEDPDADSDGDSDPEHDGELMQLGQREIGKTEIKLQTQKTNLGKGDGLSAKPKAKAAEAKKADEPIADRDDDDEDESDEDYSGEDSSDDSEMPDAEDDSDDEDEDDSSDEEEEITPKKVETGKKRAADSASKTPIPEKKAKFVSPDGGQKSGDGKKGSHTATPHPAKQVGKLTANDGKSKQQTPKSGGSVECKSCSKTFKSDNALEAHSKAKHSAAK